MFKRFNFRQILAYAMVGVILIIYFFFAYPKAHVEFKTNFSLAGICYLFLLPNLYVDLTNELKPKKRGIFQEPKYEYLEDKLAIFFKALILIPSSLLIPAIVYYALHTSLAYFDSETLKEESYIAMISDKYKSRGRHPAYYIVFDSKDYLQEKINHKYFYKKVKISDKLLIHKRHNAFGSVIDYQRIELVK